MFGTGGATCRSCSTEPSQLHGLDRGVYCVLYSLRRHSWAYAAALFAPDGGGERDGAVARLKTTRSDPKAPSMSEKPNWHDAHALMLIDQALKQGTFTAALVTQINQALAAARQADPTHRSAASR